MKQSLTLLACAIFFINGFSQKAEKIYGNARQQKSLSYYKEQQAAWKKVIDKNPKDPNAWYNYYYVNRNLMFNDTTDKRSGKEKNESMAKIVDDMGKNIPDSYEYNLSKWMIAGFDMSQLSYLKKAAELGPDRTEHLDFMINTGEISRTIKDRDLYSLKKFEAGQFSSGIIYYNYNVIAGLEPNAILITGGDNDTYPIWLLQAQGIRKDITVINLHLLGIDDYRDALFKELGIEKWFPVADAKAGKTEADHERFRTGIIKHISANKKGAPVYVALSAAQDKYTRAIEQNLYLTGLAYLYSGKTIDNIAFLKRNIEQNYAFDYIDKSFYPELSPDMVKMINRNYIVPLLTLYDHYKLAGDNQKEEWIKSRLLLVSKGTEDEPEVKKHLALNN